MKALSGWALPATQRAELNRDEYSRPDFATRAEAWVKLKEAEIVSAQEAREAERFLGETPEPVTGQLMSHPDPDGEVILRRVA
jgi:hypothetical protein